MEIDVDIYSRYNFTFMNLDLHGLCGIRFTLRETYNPKTPDVEICLSVLNDADVLVESGFQREKVLYGIDIEWKILVKGRIHEYTLRSVQNSGKDRIRVEWIVLRSKDPQICQTVWRSGHAGPGVLYEVDSAAQSRFGGRSRGQSTIASRQKYPAYQKKCFVHDLR